MSAGNIFLVPSETPDFGAINGSAAAFQRFTNAGTCSVRILGFSRNQMTVLAIRHAP